MAEHTPGPWRKTRGYVAGNGTGVVAMYVPLTDTAMNWAVGPADIEAEANGHLIKAAPEMLESLKEMRDAADHMSLIIFKARITEELDSQYIGCGRRADTIIAKAEGKEAQ